MQYNTMLEIHKKQQSRVLSYDV